MVTPSPFNDSNYISMRIIQRHLVCVGGGGVCGRGAIVCLIPGLCLLHSGQQNSTNKSFMSQS